jgi:hypothetical protein
LKEAFVFKIDDGAFRIKNRAIPVLLFFDKLLDLHSFSFGGIIFEGCFQIPGTVFACVGVKWLCIMLNKSAVGII